MGIAQSPESFLQLNTPEGAQRLLADRVRDARVALGLTQATVAKRSGVTLGTLRRFEQTGEVSLKYLLRVCHTLGRLDEFDALLRPAPAATLAELAARAERPKRKRGRR